MPDHSHAILPPDDATRAAMSWLNGTFSTVTLSFAVGDPAFSNARSAWSGDQGMLETMLAYQTRFARGMDARTQAAHLMAFYGHQLGLVFATLYLKAAQVADLHPERLAFRFEPLPAGAPPPEARRFHFQIGGLLSVEDCDPAAILHDALIESLSPVVKALSGRTGLSVAALWTLAADAVCGAFLDVGNACGDEDRAMATALSIVHRQPSPFFSGRLRFERVEALVDGETVERIYRLRGGCCLFYRTEGGAMCDVCVLLDDAERIRRLRRHLQAAAKV